MLAPVLVLHAYASRHRTFHISSTVLSMDQILLEPALQPWLQELFVVAFFELNSTILICQLPGV